MERFFLFSQMEWICYYNLHANIMHNFKENLMDVKQIVDSRWTQELYNLVKKL